MEYQTSNIAAIFSVLVTSGQKRCCHKNYVMFVGMSLQNVLFLPLLFWAVYHRFQDHFVVSNRSWVTELLVCILMRTTANILEICNTDRVLLPYFKPVLLILFSSRSPKELQNLLRKPCLSTVSPI